MPEVQTARGPVPTDRLGSTLTHEHVFILDPEVLVNFPTHWDEEEGVASAIVKLNELKAAGIDSIVDPTVYGQGRNIRLIQRVAEGTDLNILVATGAYVFNDLPQWFQFRGMGRPEGDPDLLTELFVRDITEGVLETGVRAAILKCATDEPGVTPDVERVLRAVAQAQLETGVPITTHTHAETRRGLEQQRILAEEGVDLGRVIIGHCGDTSELSYLEELLRAGSYLGMDRFGLDHFLPMEDRVRTVVELCERGWAHRLLLSHDCSVHLDWFEPSVLAELVPDWSYLLVTRDVLPALRERGVTEEAIEQMMVANPREIFEAG